MRHEPDLEPADDQRPGDLPADGTDGPLELPKPTPSAPAGQPGRRELRMLTMVLVCHLGVSLGPRVSPEPVLSMVFGITGVAFFFVLSGFVLTWSRGRATPRRRSGAREL